VPCPDCGQALERSLAEESRTEVDVDFSLDDAEMAGS
jgi:hypothetical protein